MAVTGWIITMFAEMFGVELAAIVEASTEETNKAEDKKAEKTSLKEENKEVCENVEIKVDEREKPKMPVSLFEVSPGFVRPVVLNKPELDLLPEPIMPPIFKEVIKEEIREVKETKPKVEEKKQEEPKVAVCPPAPKTATETGQVRNRTIYRCDSGWGKMTEQNNNNTYQASSQSAQSFVSDKKASNQSTKSPVPNGKALNTQDSVVPSKDAPEQSARSSVADCECNFPVGFWKGAEHEGSVGDAQAKVSSELTGPKANNLVEGQSVGKT